MAPAVVRTPGYLQEMTLHSNEVGWNMGEGGFVLDEKSLYSVGGWRQKERSQNKGEELLILWVWWGVRRKREDEAHVYKWDQALDRGG